MLGCRRKRGEEEDRRGPAWQNPTCRTLLGGDTLIPALTPFPSGHTAAKINLHERRGKKGCPIPSTGRHRSFRKRVSITKDDLYPQSSLSSEVSLKCLACSRKGTEILLNKYQVALSSIEQALILIKRYFDLERVYERKMR